MLLLATDTSGRNGSIALAHGGASGACQVLEVTPVAGGTFSAQLVPVLAALLARHGLHKGQIDALAVASGPGSFTGLRVGLAAVKALADVFGKPLAEVSLLEAVAQLGLAQAPPQDTCLAILDAGRGEYYVGDYQARPHAALKRSERLSSLEQVLAEARGRRCLTPDPSIAATLRAGGASVELVRPVDAGDVARLGWEKVLRGELVPPANLDANYIRRSDPEIFAKRP